jgi:branched-chain amino acid aminotransferase
MYGESVFTTMLMLDGTVQNWDKHFERLKKSVEFVYGPFPEDDWVQMLKNRFNSYMRDCVGDKVIRLTVYREKARGLIRTGLISISDLKINCEVTTFDRSRVHNKMISLRTSPVFRRPNWWPSYLKAGNYLETILAQKVYLQPQDDDVLFISQSDTILESSIANIFVVRHNKLYTPPTGPNVLDGIMRSKVIEVAGDFFDEFEETETSFDQLLRADAIFGSNSVRGIFLVNRIDDHEIVYEKEFLDKFSRLKHKVFL